MGCVVKAIVARSQVVEVSSQTNGWEVGRNGGVSGARFGGQM